MDTLARQRRARFLVKSIFVIILFVAAGGGVVYLLFFSRLLDVRSITINGLTTLNSDEVRQAIDTRLDNKIIGYIQRRRDIMFLGVADMKADILSQFPVLNSIDIQKQWPHGLIINLSERTAIGVWCYKGGDCQYFDSGGNTWGQVIKSSGFLMIAVDDKRNTDTKQIDKEYFNAIKTFIENQKLLSFSVKDITIAQDSFRDYIVGTAASYPLYFSLDSNILDQVKVLNIFLENKSKGGDFNPQYVDLRINGRIYYK